VELRAPVQGRLIDGEVIADEVFAEEVPEDVETT
jgi:hypothetical protein